MPRKRYVTGQERIDRALAAMTGEIRAQIAAELDRQAEEIRARAALLAPKDTGELAAAIEVRDSLDGFRGSGAVGNFARLVRGEAAGLSRFVGVFPARRGSPGWYAAWVEFGTVRTAAQPFLRPAFFSRRKRALAAIRRAITRGARQAAKAGR